jgi:hypothetical protein
MDTLSKLDGSTRETVLKYAEEAVRDSWWASAQEHSRELGLGDLWSDGRSGGWLVFKTKMTELEELIADVEKGCRHCALGFDHHISGKCPFQASSFEVINPDSFKKWDAFKVFAEDVKHSLQNMESTFEDEVLFQLENLDDDPAARVPNLGGSEKNPVAFQENAEEEG